MYQDTLLDHTPSPERTPQRSLPSNQLEPTKKEVATPPCISFPADLYTSGTSLVHPTEYSEPPADVIDLTLSSDEGE